MKPYDKGLMIVFFMGILALILGGASCPQKFPTEVNYSVNGELMAGRKCVTAENGDTCCTSKIPYKGTVREITACYPPDAVPEKEVIPAE